MTTLIAPRADYRLTFGRVLHSEWTKFRSLRSTWLALAATIVLSLGLATLFGWSYAKQIDAGEVEPSVAEAIDVAFLAMDLPALVLAILGVLQMGGEYGTGSIRSTLTAVPRRLAVLWAKALVLLLVAVPVMGAVSLISFVVSQAFAGSDGATLTDPGVARAIAGVTAYIVALGLLGLGVAAIVRNTAAAITLVVVVMLVVPGLVVAMPDAVQDHIAPYLPILAASAMYTQDDGGGDPGLLSPGAGAIVLLAWILAALAAGALVLKRRDA
jgi:ABC-type transport system involved in multi-copper enzyme maturation permease subunit